MKRKKYVRLTYSERIEIEVLLKAHKSRSEIAKALNRHRSTITRELNTWINKPSHIYEAELANWCAHEVSINKRNLDKISTHNSLKIYVYRELLSKNSPEQISGRIKIDFPNNPIMRISHEAIYTHIYNHNIGKLRKKLIALLLYSTPRK